MDWHSERYVRVYTRDTMTWKLLDWKARTTMLMMLRAADRAGVIDVGEHGVEGLSALLEMPSDVVGPGVAQLEKRGVVLRRELLWVFPNFIEAQEAISGKNGAIRMRALREKRRDVAKLQDKITSDATGDNPHAVTSHVTHQVTAVTDVTSSDEKCAPVPCRAVPSHTLVAFASLRDPSSFSIEGVGSSSSKGVGTKGGSKSSGRGVVTKGVGRDVTAIEASLRSEWSELFSTVHGGARPTWDTTPRARLQQLLRIHSESEILRRMNIAFTAPPKWPPPPYSFVAFANHFDLFATPSKPDQPKISPHQAQMNAQLDRVAMFERMEKEPHDYDGDPRVHPTCRLCRNPPEHWFHARGLNGVPPEPISFPPELSGNNANHDDDGAPWEA